MYLLCAALNDYETLKKTIHTPVYAAYVEYFTAQ